MEDIATENISYTIFPIVCFMLNLHRFQSAWNIQLVSAQKLTNRSPTTQGKPTVKLSHGDNAWRRLHNWLDQILWTQIKWTPVHCLRENGKKCGGEICRDRTTFIIMYCHTFRKDGFLLPRYLKLCHVLDTQLNSQDFNSLFNWLSLLSLQKYLSAAIASF